MRISAICCAILVCASTLPGQSGTEVGAGAPNEYIRTLFVNAYNRGRFAALAGAPLGAVRRFGPTGLIQEFQGSGTAARAALVRSTTLSEPDNTLADVFQVLPDIYAYYSSVGVTTAGYPVNDTLICPNASCQYQVFSNSHALVSWSAGTNDVDNITVKDVFYTRWLSNGGAAAMGAPTTAEQDITSSFGSAARTQRFTNGAIYNISSGPLSGRLVSIRPPVAALYFARGAHAGQLGLPATEEMIQPTGVRRQSFEGGSIEYQGNSPPVIRTPIHSIVLRPAATPVRMNLGETVTLQAVPISTDGHEISDRPVAFSTSNGRVISLQTGSQTVTVRAVGGGTANLTATAEGKVSLPITFIVSAPCCQIGEGAPTASVQQAMQDAVMRNRLNLRLPGPERVRRSGAGYVQEFQSADASATRYLIAISDKSAPAFVVAGALLNRYEQLGGPVALGYPIADASAGGRQVFEGGALAGSPVHLVAGLTLQKWSALGYETGAVGLPIGEAARITSFLGTSGQVQSFEKGVIVSTAKGAFQVSGLILARYLALNGALGSIGFPTADEATIAGKRRQDFEGGSIEYSSGDTQTNAIFKDRKPAVSAAPASVLPGARLRLTASGFAEGSMLRITGGSDPEFRVQTSTGSYVWDVYVPSSAAPGAVRVRAVEAGNASASAETTYIVRSLGEARARLVRVLGDTQNGVPGNVLPLPLRVAVQDDAGNPLAGVTVRFTASPGAEVIPSSAETDMNGLAETHLKMPPVEGVALVNVEALRQVTTFSARAAAVSLGGFPKLMQTGSGAMMAAAASIIRHLQLRGEVPSPNGLADVATLEQFLKSFCTVDYQGTQYCDGFLTSSNNEEQIVNLWRLPAFAGQSFEMRIGKADQSLARDAISRGLPVLLPIPLQRNGVPAGIHYVAGTGINADSSIQIHDPNSQFGRQRLNDYISGFTVGPDRWTGRLAAVAEFLPGRSTHTSFLVVSGSESISISSRSGSCGETLELAVFAGRDTLRVRGCDGAAGEYQVELGGQGTVRALITDLAENGARFEVAGSSAAFRASRPGPWLMVTPQETAIADRGIVNAATFTPEIAAGSLISIFGSGLSRLGSPTKVSVGGQESTIVAADPFQVNAAVPADVPPGIHHVRIESPYGVAEEEVEIRPIAPVVFSVGPGQPAVVNQDGRLNRLASPAHRGDVLVIYTTGLGRTKTNNSLFVTEAVVSASILNQEMPVTFSGLAPGFVGLYQINVLIPLTTPVGSAVPLVIRQGGVEARPVEVAIQ